MSITTREDLSMSRCDNCQVVLPTEQLEEPSHLWERMDPGGEVPSGECPECGSLAYLLNPETLPKLDYLISVGDHGTAGLGIGLCARIQARSKEEAIARFRFAMGDMDGCGIFELDLREANMIQDGILSKREGEYVTLYVEPKNITAEQIVDDETEEA